MIDILLKTDPLGQDWHSAEDSAAYLVSGLRWRLVNRLRLWRPPMDLYETDEALVVRVEIAGMREADFSIVLQQPQLLINGVRGEARPIGSERRAYHQMEIPFGEFAIEIELPVEVDSEKVQAAYHEGFLKIVLPKAISPQTQTQMIPIKE